MPLIENNLNKLISETMKHNTCEQIMLKNTKTKGPKSKKGEFHLKDIDGGELKCDNQFILLLVLLLFLLLSLIGTSIMWFTSMFDNAIFSNLAIVNNTQSYEMWRKPSPKPLLKVYLFNYTNAEEYTAGNADKLHVKEIGPYVYEETLERVNIKFNGSYVSYQEYREYKFLPDLSNGKQGDQLMVPNIPLFAGAAVNRHSDFLTRLAFSSLVLKTLSVQPFLKMSAHRYIIGYEDNYYSLAKSAMKFQNKKLYDRVGLLNSKIGLQEDIITINTGVKDINKVNLIASFNGKTSLDHWSTKECNSITSATDGSMFSSKKIREKQPVKIFIKELCRTLPLYFEKEVSLFNGKIPAYRYNMPLWVLDSPDNHPSNQCYCNLDSGECPPQGVHNVTPCAFGAPAYLSFPHFYNADPKIREGVTGLDPNYKNYQTYADLHPTMGYVMNGKTRFQLNIQVMKSFGISQLDNFEDGLMLPVSWIEMSLEDKTLPEDIVYIIFQTSITVNIVENTLKYGCLCTALTTIIVIGVVLRNRWKKRRDARSDSIRKLQKNEEVPQV